MTIIKATNANCTKINHNKTVTYKVVCKVNVNLMCVMQL